MADIETAAERPSIRNPLKDRPGAWPLLFLMIAALILRAPVYGNPDYHLDEEFYLLVADRMWDGWLPYVDIWDRKPIGLFLIYAAARAMGGEGFAQYQILASLSAGATAAFIYLMARRFAGTFGSIAAGVCYLFWINMFSGGAGQSPVFYNALMAWAAWLALKAGEDGDIRRIACCAFWAMLACGIILQIKYTALPEGMFLGCWFVWLLWKAGASVRKIAGIAAAMIAIALAPTALAIGFYAALGHLDAFLYANFLSVFSRGHLGERFMQRALGFFTLVNLPLAISLCFAILKLSATASRRDSRFLTLWLIAALVGFAMIGNYYDHYFLPVLVPAFTIAAAVLTLPLVGVTLCAVLVLWSALVTKFPKIAYHRAEREAIMRLTQETRPWLNGACLYIFDGPSSLYQTTNACIPTRYVYPDHLSNAVERTAIGVDPVAELKRILASRPGAIITADAPVIPTLNRDTVALLQQALRRDYVCVAAVKAPDRIFYVSALKSRVPPGRKALRCPSRYVRLG